MRGPWLFDQQGLVINYQTHFYVYKGRDGRFSKKVFVVRDEAPYFSDAVGFSLSSLLVNPAPVTTI